MKIRYLLKKAELSDKERDYLEEKINRLEKYFKDLPEGVLKAEAEVEGSAKGIWRVELMLESPRQLYRASKTGGSFMEAVDLAAAALQMQVSKKRSQMKERRRE